MTDLTDNMNKKDLNQLLGWANANEDHIKKKMDKQIIAGLAQEVAMKNQVIASLESKLEQFEKTN